MPSISSKAIIKRIEKDGWLQVRVEGNKDHFKHNKKKEKVTVKNPKKDLKQKTSKRIIKQEGLDETI